MGSITLTESDPLRNHTSKPVSRTERKPSPRRNLTNPNLKIINEYENTYSELAHKKVNEYDNTYSEVAIIKVNENKKSGEKND